METEFKVVQQDCKALTDAGTIGTGGKQDPELLCVGPKRQLEVQLSEVSDETCDRAAIAFLSNFDDPRRTAGSPLAKRPKTLVHAPDTGGSGSVAAAAAALCTPVRRFQQHLLGRLSSPMGPPAPAMPQLALGSLLVAAQMASGSTACSTGGHQGDRNSPLLPATQATLQATTASVVAAEVLAAMSRPTGVSCNAGTACAGAGIAEALAGWLANNSTIQSPPAAAAAQEPAVQQPQQQQQLQPMECMNAHAPHGTCADFPAGHAAGMQTDECSPDHQPAQHMDDQDMSPPPAAAATAPEAVSDPGCTSHALPIQATAVADAAAATPAAHIATAATGAQGQGAQSATPAAASLQLPSWLCQPSAGLAASQAICQASLLSTTAALARLSSPRGHTAAAAAAASCRVQPTATLCARSTWPAAVTVGHAGVSPTGQAGATAAVVSTDPAGPAWVMPTLPVPAGAAAAAVAPVQPTVVIGVPAEAPAADGVAWGLPLGPAAASAGTILAAAAAVTPLGDMDGRLLAPLRTACKPAEGLGADAGSCSGSPRAGAAGAHAGTAAAHGGAAAAATLAAAAARLTAAPQLQEHQQRQQQQEEEHGAEWGLSPGGVPCVSSVSLTASDAASDPAAEVTSEFAERDAGDSAAVYVMVGVTRTKLPAAAAAKAGLAATAAPATCTGAAAAP